MGGGGQGRVGRELRFLILNVLHILDFSLCTLIQIVKLFAPRLYVPEHEEGLRRSHDSMPQGEGSSRGGRQSRAGERLTFPRRGLWTKGYTILRRPDSLESNNSLKTSCGSCQN